MKQYIVLIAFFLSSCAVANSDDCFKPDDMQQIRECAAQSLSVTEGKMNALIQEIYSDLIDYVSKEEAENFSTIQEQWQTIIDSQCKNQRTLYGNGSLWC